MTTTHVKPGNPCANDGYSLLHQANLLFQRQQPSAARKTTLARIEIHFPIASAPRVYSTRKWW
jgi:hypothetical protein